MGTQEASTVAVPPSAERPTQPARIPMGRQPSTCAGQMNLHASTFELGALWVEEGQKSHQASACPTQAPPRIQTLLAKTAPPRSILLRDADRPPILLVTNMIAEAVAPGVSTTGHKLPVGPLGGSNRKPCWGEGGGEGQEVGARKYARAENQQWTELPKALRKFASSTQREKLAEPLYSQADGVTNTDVQSALLLRGPSWLSTTVVAGQGLIQWTI
ncbi:MAG: hypothetical protein FRX49_00822 [Trebouxia sp. A1-2]|nr:MAG: hypothetical protein FRX49_00822 [Trebouxia sp. A1-2]